MTYHVQFLLLVLAGWVNRQQQDVIDYLREENRVLRGGLRGKRLRLSDDERRRLAVKAQALGREALAQIASVATPATLLRWYRYLIATKYDGSKNRSPSRPLTAKDIRELIVRVAQENPTWGYTRLRGALKNLGHELGRNTIKRVLADHGIAPAPERGKSMSWSTLHQGSWGRYRCDRPVHRRGCEPVRARRRCCTALAESKCAYGGGRGMFDHEVSQAQPVQAREAEEVPRSQLGGIQRRAAPPRRFDGLV